MPRRNICFSLFLKLKSIVILTLNKIQDIDKQLLDMGFLKNIEAITKEMIFKKHIWFLLFMALLGSACKESDDTEGLVVYPPTNSISRLTTDKAIYVPGEKVQFSFEGS